MPPQNARSERPAASIHALLIDERVKAIVRTMIDEPRQPFVIQRLSGVARSTLYTRLGDLVDLEIVDVERISEFPLRVAYGLTDTGRLVFVGGLLAERAHRRRLPFDNGEEPGGLAELVGLLAPIARLPRGSKGRCAFVERNPHGRQRTVCLSADAGKLHVVSASGRNLARASGTAGEWDAALTGGGRHRLNLVGDLGFARRTVASLRAALRV